MNHERLADAGRRAPSRSRSRAPLRTRRLSTKVTDAEYHTFERLARGQSLSEWIRRVLRDHASRRELEETVLAELLALRTILLNLQFAVAAGSPPTADEMRQLIERADEERFRKAQERLAAARTAPPFFLLSQRPKVRHVTSELFASAREEITSRHCASQCGPTPYRGP